MIEDITCKKCKVNSYSVKVNGNKYCIKCAKLVIRREISRSIKVNQIHFIVLPKYKDWFEGYAKLLEEIVGSKVRITKLLLTDEEQGDLSSSFRFLIFHANYLSKYILKDKVNLTLPFTADIAFAMLIYAISVKSYFLFRLLNNLNLGNLSIINPLIYYDRETLESVGYKTSWELPNEISIFSKNVSKIMSESQELSRSFIRSIDLLTPNNNFCVMCFYDVDSNNVCQKCSILMNKAHEGEFKEISFLI
jgi:hypothetical protein